MLALDKLDGTGPTVIFLPGYASDMTGAKAVALGEWARAAGRAFVRFDYRGCGASAGRSRILRSTTGATMCRR